MAAAAAPAAAALAALAGTVLGVNAIFETIGDVRRFGFMGGSRPGSQNAFIGTALAGEAPPGFFGGVAKYTLGLPAIGAKALYRPLPDSTLKFLADNAGDAGAKAEISRRTEARQKEQGAKTRGNLTERTTLLAQYGEQRIGSIGGNLDAARQRLAEFSTIYQQEIRGGRQAGGPAEFDTVGQAGRNVLSARDEVQRLQEADKQRRLGRARDQATLGEQGLRQSVDRAQAAHGRFQELRKQYETFLSDRYQSQEPNAMRLDPRQLEQKAVRRGEGEVIRQMRGPVDQAANEARKAVGEVVKSEIVLRQQIEHIIKIENSDPKAISDSAIRQIIGAIEQNQRGQQQTLEQGILNKLNQNNRETMNRRNP